MMLRQIQHFQSIVQQILTVKWKCTKGGADILLDVMQVRETYVKDSSLIWKLCETGEVEGYVSSMTFTNLVYVMRKELDPQGIHDVLNKLQLIFHITALSETDLKQASEME